MQQRPSSVSAVSTAGPLPVRKSTASINDFLMASALLWSRDETAMKKIDIRETEDRRFKLAESELGGRWNSQEHGGPLQVFVPYASPELAQQALDAAAALAGSLGAQAVLVAVHVVSPLLPLDEPNVSREFLEKKLESVAERSALPARVEIVFAREQETGFRTVLPQGSLVLIATRKHLWRTAEEKLARFLERAGHSVVLLTV